MQIPVAWHLYTTAQVVNRNSKKSIRFSPEQPPDCPGVYCVVMKGEVPEPFYIGETKNLQQRLKKIFRCLRDSNPHPCHSAYEICFKKFPDVQDFCNNFAVWYTTTQHMTGRLELEEELQKTYGTNRKNFYNKLKLQGGEIN